MAEEEPEIPLHQENLTSIALDGAGISAFTALTILLEDPQLDDEQRAVLGHALDNALMWLNLARKALPVETTSLHVASSPQPRIIVPGA